MPGFVFKDQAEMIQGDVVKVVIGKLRRPVVTVQTGPANHAAAAIAIQGRVNSRGSWITLTYRTNTGADANSLVGPDKLGTVDSDRLGACTEVQATRTDANGAVCQVYVAVSSND